MDLTIHKEGKRYLVTPMLRFVKKNDKLILEQMFMEQSVFQPKQVKQVWFEVPTSICESDSQNENEVNNEIKI